MHPSLSVPYSPDVVSMLQSFILLLMHVASFGNANLDEVRCVFQGEFVFSWKVDVSSDYFNSYEVLHTL